MSQKWYPIINYETCVECGACVEKSTHGCNYSCQQRSKRWLLKF